MKIIQYKFDRAINIVNLGDVHRGSKNCNTRFFKSVVERIASEPDTYWVSTGDLLEVSIKHSIGNVHESVSVQHEIDLLSEELAQIRDKCLGFVASNHHNRVDKNTGLSLDRAFAAQAGIPFLGITGVINATVGQGSYFICLHHGTGGGTAGNAVNRAIQAAGIYKGCDVYMSGHTHKMDVHPFTQNIIDRKRNIIRSVQSFILITGHCLDWEDSYAESMNLPPAPLGFSCVELGLNTNGKESVKSIKPWFITA